jgi:hypothetical protein
LEKDFLYFGQTLMDDHKLVMNSIFFYFQNMRKMQFFNKNMLGKFLEFDRMHENKIFFVFFCFLKKKINLKVSRFFLFFLIYIYILNA